MSYESNYTDLEENVMECNSLLKGEYSDERCARDASERGGGYSKTVGIVKGMAIILMVLGHSGFPFTHFVYLFHMAVFFIASGILWDVKKSESVKQVSSYIFRKIKSLWVPFVICNSIFLTLSNFLIDVGIYTDIPLQTIGDTETYPYVITQYMDITRFVKEEIRILMFTGSTQLGGATWFFRALFVISIAHCCLEFTIAKIAPNLRTPILVFDFIVICILCKLMNSQYLTFPSNIIRSCVVGYIPYLIGILLKEFGGFERISDRRKNAIVGLISFIILLLLNPHGNIEISTGSISGVLFFIIASLMGWFLLVEIASVLCNTIVGDGLDYIGKRSLSIVVWHFLCFKIVSIFYCELSGSPFEIIACFPCVKKGFLWIAYGIVGVAFPVILDYFLSKFGCMIHYRRKIHSK